MDDFCAKNNEATSELLAACKQKRSEIDGEDLKKRLQKEFLLPALQYIKRGQYLLGDGDRDTQESPEPSSEESELAPRLGHAQVQFADGELVYVHEWLGPERDQLIVSPSWHTIVTI
jgi:hypothetical protein